MTRTRRQDLARITATDIDALRGVVGVEGLNTDPQELITYNRDWLGRYIGSSSLAVCPSTTSQVSNILTYCNKRKIAVVPQGGNTGLVGGSVPVFDELVLSMSRMNRVINIDESSSTLVAEAGCILESTDNELASHGLCMPLDLGAKGTCQLGGNLATNAGGLRFLRYGSLRGTVLGIEAVLPDGTIINNLSTLRKDNTGYDLKQLFIGSEGTLGVITKVAMSVPRRPSSVKMAFVAANSFEQVLEIAARARKHLGEILSTLEFQDRASLDCVLSHIESSRDPLSQSHPFYVIVETSGHCTESDDKRLNEFLMTSMDDGVIADGTVAQDSNQMSALWALRENIAASLAALGAVYKYDVSIPTTLMYTLVEEMQSRLKGLVDAKFVTGYGHVGDANLHLNIVVPQYDEAIRERIEPFVYERISTMKGSISAEHGLGVQKAEHMHFSKSSAMIHMMTRVKALFDPNGIMNPYK